MGLSGKSWKRKLKEGSFGKSDPFKRSLLDVGGWLAQSGAGYGSYEFGWGYENMEKARVVFPTGEVGIFRPELENVDRDNGDHRHNHRNYPECPETSKREKPFLPGFLTLHEKSGRNHKKKNIPSGHLPS